MTAVRPETTSEHIARDIREGRFPERSEPQMVADPTDTTPERIWIDAWGGNWSPQAGGTQGIEYIRADLAAVQPAQPDPHDEVIARLVEALRNLLGIAEDEGIVGDKTTLELARAALAAAKAVQHD